LIAKGVYLRVDRVGLLVTLEAAGKAVHPTHVEGQYQGGAQPRAQTGLSLAALRSRR
jgi:hypothetical protein